MPGKSTLVRFSIVMAVVVTANMPLLAGDTQPESESEDRAQLLHIVDVFFEALETQDGEVIKPLFHEGACGASLRWDADGNPVLRHGPSPVLPQSEDVWTERYWDPTVLVEGSIATVWAPYDFYVNERFNHCGIDVFNFFKLDGQWKIINTAYTVVQDGSCELHPDGPPSF